MAEGKPVNGSNYYCPLNGKTGQRTIVFLPETLQNADIGTIKSIYGDSLVVIDYGMAKKYLLKATSESFKRNMASKRSSPASSDSDTTVMAPSTAQRGNAPITAIEDEKL